MKSVNTKPQKLLSVILPIYNQAEFLDECLESLYLQKKFSWENSEIILIDDGSTDKIERVIARWRKKIPLLLIKHKTNLGIASSLNDGLKKAKGKYLARMDADDVAVNKRFYKQLKFLASHNKVDLLGGQIINFDDKNDCKIEKKPIIKFPLPINNLEIQKALFFYCPLMHPTLMWRRDWQKKVNFRYLDKIKLGDKVFNNLLASEDYPTWLYFVDRTNFANLSEILIKHRCHCGQVSTKRKKEQKELTRELAKNYRKDKIQTKNHFIKMILDCNFTPLKWRLHLIK